MIEISRKDKGNIQEICLKGHAGAAEPGYDIVCAAASALLWALYANVEKHCDTFSADMEPGDSRIIAKDAGICFDVIMEGYRWLQQNYPEYIKIV